MEENTPKVVSVGQKQEVKYPINLKVLLIRGEKKGMFVCQCGNIDQYAFQKFHAMKLIKDARGRMKNIKVLELLCTKCKASISYSVVAEQYKMLTKMPT